MAGKADHNGLGGDQDSTAAGDFDLDRHIPYLLVRSANQIGQITHQRYQDAVPEGQALSLREFRTLLIVASRGVVAPAAVAEATGMDRATVTRALATLRNKGFVTEFQNEQDKRAKFITLTQNGADLSNRIFPQMQAYTDKIEAAFSPAEIRQFTVILERMVLLFLTDPT